MAYTNSSLVTYKRLSSKKTSPRNHAIDTITIHCYVGQVTAKEGCDYFATTDRDVSANYVVGKDGSIGLCVEEKNRAWTTSSRSNDHRAITIEVACSKKSPYTVTAAAYSALIELVADICKRNNIKELKWKNDKSLIGKVAQQNMTVHRWFDATACPGEYLFTRHGEIAAAVNAKLKKAEEESKKPAKKETTKSTSKVYKIQIGAYRIKTFANNQLKKVKAKGFDAVVVKVGNLYKVQAGAYTNKKNAEALQKKLKSKGFDSVLVVEDKVAKPVVFCVGDKVKMKKDAPEYGKSTTFKSWVYNSTLYVRQVDGNRITISTLKSGAVTGAVDKKYLTKT